VVTFRELPFVKGHGTENDFVIIPDLDGQLDLTVEQIQWLCDRRRGIGADGVLRVVRTEHMGHEAGPWGVAEFFMDYRNGDGSLAEMCGNGARVFVRYLHAAGLITRAEAVIGTRGGLRSCVIQDDGSITVDMGAATQPAIEPTVHLGSSTWPAMAVLVPNPHAVAFVDDLDDLDALGCFDEAPTVGPDGAYPDGANVEFVVHRGPRHVAMRVHERGVGETRSCGTGACAVAWTARRRDEPGVTGETTYRIDVPGGSVTVTESAAGAMLLTGPAELVARGTVLVPDL
jgi:diaminopimelate epimerase